MRRARRVGCAGLLALVMVAGVTSLPADAAAKKKKKRAEVVRITKVNDGDTVTVDRNHDGRGDVRVRLLGIDTPEKGTCNAHAATLALRRLVRHKKVKLTSQTASTGIKHRIERLVWVKRGGRWIDTSKYLLEGGYGVWMPRHGEFSHSLAEHRAADQAAAAGLHWFDSDRCGAGPAAADTITMNVEWQADAAPAMPLSWRRNQEFLRLRNDGPEPVDMSNWTLRVGNDRSLRVPPGDPIPPGETLTVHVGSGTDSTYDRYLGRTVPMLVNANLGPGPHLGAGSYLVDPDGDIRAHQTWPCTVGCADPTGGALQISHVEYNPPGDEQMNRNAEYVTLTNNGASAIRTGDLVVDMKSYIYELPPDHWLQPGESMTIHVGDGTSDRLTRYVGAPNAILGNAGSRVLVRTYDAIVVDCVHWGTGSCP